MAVPARPPQVGQLLREWRRRRNLSQFQLATGSAVSARHLSFVETGRARPSREMVLYLAERLDVPLRERNRLLMAAGYAPVFGERSIEDEEMAPAREAVERFLAAHEPFPAIAVDRRWNLVRANGPTSLLLEGVDADLLEPPVNALRVALHPRGLAPRIRNFDEWSAHLVDRVRRELALSGDAELAELLEELSSFPGVRTETERADVPRPTEILLPLRLRHGDRDLSFFSTATTFGTALDVTLAELTIEAFYPADAETARLLEGRAVSAG